MDFNCFDCSKIIDGGLDGLASHLKSVHHLPLSKSNKDAFKCGQHGCFAKFSVFRSLRSHISKQHCSVDLESRFDFNSIPNSESDNENEYYGC